jgi:hypothetical protein
VALEMREEALGMGAVPVVEVVLEREVEPVLPKGLEVEKVRQTEAVLAMVEALERGAAVS